MRSIGIIKRGEGIKHDSRTQTGQRQSEEPGRQQKALKVFHRELSDKSDGYWIKGTISLIST